MLINIKTKINFPSLPNFNFCKPKSIFFFFLSYSEVFLNHTAWKLSQYEVFSGPYYLYSDWIRRFTSPNTGKYGPEKTLHLENFHAVPESSFHAPSFMLRIKLSCCFHFATPWRVEVVKKPWMGWFSFTKASFLSK